ncbi:hypothetical protein GCM10010166_21140 [Couchioplanes caeruleus subsp. azureus]|nr:hypothetical protein GCM10010166_21140 [Couchioplanes caeruleus subsp. azureus]
MSERMSTAPRSGGRTAERVDKGRRTPAGTKGTARGARQFPIQGTTALKLDAEQQRDTVAAPRLRVAPPAPINAPRAPFIALVVAVVVAGVLGILLINTKTAENSFELDTLQKQQAELNARQQALENEIAANNMPGNLDAAARRLGLVKADSPAYLRMPDGKVFGVMKPGSGPQAVTAQDPAAATTAEKNAATARQGTSAQDATTRDVTPDAANPAGAPAQVAPGQAVPGQAVPGQAVPGQAVPGQAVPGQAVPGQAVPGQAVPGQAVPGQAVPGQGALPAAGQ